VREEHDGGGSPGEGRALSVPREEQRRVGSVVLIWPSVGIWTARG